MDGENLKNTVYITEQEKKVLSLMRSVDYGEVRVVINAGKPVRIEEIRKSIKLD